MSTPTYQDERWCPKCQAYTQHQCVDGNHERDSSNDYQECTKCRWWGTGGWSANYEPPLNVKSLMLPLNHPAVDPWEATLWTAFLGILFLGTIALLLGSFGVFLYVVFREFPK